MCPLALWQRDPRTVRDLGEALQLEPATLSPLLKRLEAQGYVTRHRNARDERALDVALTDEGRALQEKAFAISEEMIGAIGFDAPEFDDLKTKLRLLTERVSATPAG